MVDNGFGRDHCRSLLSRLHNGKEERESAIAELQSGNQASVTQILSGLLSDENSDLRCDAAEALMRLNARATLMLVLPLLKDRVVGVRWHTCGLLFQFGDSRATPHLVSVVNSDRDERVRFFAVDALARIGDETALPALRNSEANDDGVDGEGRPIRIAASEAIEEILFRHRDTRNAT